MNGRFDIKWWVIILALMFFWPLGLVLLFIKLFGSGYKNGERYKNNTGYRKGGYRVPDDYIDVPYSSSDGEIGAKLSGDRSIFSRRKGRLLKGLGIALLVGGAACAALTFLGSIASYYYFYEAALMSSMVFIAFGAPGLALTLWGSKMADTAGRYLRYYHMIGDSHEISLDRLSGAMGLPFERICKDLGKMLESGFFAGYYIDMERRVFTDDRLSGSVFPSKEEKAQHEAAMSPADNIRFINGTILEPEVSEKVMRLETLTRRIYKYTEVYPEKERLAKSFKEKYLPKTIKILEAYSRFENSGSSGENVKEAMKDIEAVLDVLISSFEKQLDMLYMDEALDITTDIEVLEKMLSGDGLGDSPFAKRQGE